MKKRFVSLVLSVALALSLLPAAALAREEAPEAVETEAVCTAQGRGRRMLQMERRVSGGEDEAALLAGTPDLAGASAAMRRCIVNHLPGVNLEQYGISEDDLDEITHELTYRYGELFDWGAYVKPDGAAEEEYYGGTHYAPDGIVLWYRPFYSMNQSEYDAAKDFYNKELDKIVAQVPAGLTAEEKALFIHDYLACHYEYDRSLENNDAYVFLRDKKGVCQSYMLTFSALMDKLGIPCSYVESDKLNHAWNLVQLEEDGPWYHVDVTHDDPYFVGSGEVVNGVRHSYFLISDARSEELRGANEDWFYGVKVRCTDSGKEAFYAGVDSPMVYVPGNGTWYYADTDPDVQDNRGLYACRFGQGSEKVCDYQYVWQRGGIVGMVEYAGCLFYSDMNHIYRYDLDSAACAREGKDQIETLLTVESGVDGLMIEDGVLSYKDDVTVEMVTLDAELLPWHAVKDEEDNTLFHYYYNFGRVGLRVPEGGPAAAVCAWYDGEGGLARLAMPEAGTSGTFGEPAAAGEAMRCALFALDSQTSIPLRSKLELYPKPAEDVG